MLWSIEMIFQLDCSGYDTVACWLFEHNNKTQEDFQKDCDELIVKYGDEYLDDSIGSWHQ